MTGILGVDTSNHNHAHGPIDFAAVKASGRTFVVLKASEGVGFKDPYLDADRAAAHAAGLIVLLYHFGRGGDPAAEAAWFLRCVGPLQVGEGVVLDDEVPGITPAWVQAWCGAIHQATTVWALVYMNQAARDAGDWRAVGATDGLWLAKYDGTTTLPASGSFGGTAMKQYTSTGTVAGIAGAVDLDVFFGTADQLAAYGLHATPGGFLMALTDQQQTDLYNGVTYIRAALKDGGPDASPSGRPLNALIQEVADQLAPIYRPDSENADATGHVPFRQDMADGVTFGEEDKAALAALATGLQALAAQVTALQQAVAASPGMTCQGSPAAVVSAFGAKLSAPTAAPTGT